MGWTFPCRDYLTGEMRHSDLPLTVPSYTEGLGPGVGSCTATIPLDAGIDVDTVCGDPSALIVPTLNGSPQAAFVVMETPTYSAADDTVSLSMAAWDTPILNREVWSTLPFIQQDRNVIARSLFAYAIGLTPLAVDPSYLAMMTVLPLNFRVPWVRFDTSTVSYRAPLDRLDNDAGYTAANHPKVGAAITGLLTLEGGFQYRKRVDVDQDGLFYAVPEFSSGKTFDRGEPVWGLEYPSASTLDLTYAKSWADTETASRGWGSGSGGTKIAGAIAYNNRHRIPGAMGSENVDSLDAAVIAAAGRSRSAAHDGADETYTFEVAETQIERFRVGDRVSVRVRTRRWPWGRNGMFQVVFRTVRPSQAGTPGTITVSVVEVEA